MHNVVRANSYAIVSERKSKSQDLHVAGSLIRAQRLGGATLVIE